MRDRCTSLPFTSEPVHTVSTSTTEEYTFTACSILTEARCVQTPVGRGAEAALPTEDLQMARRDKRDHDEDPHWASGNSAPMDLPSEEKWYEYSRARELMLQATDTSHAL